MRIVYCIAGTRHSGGMERVLTLKANWWVSHGQEVIIVTTDQMGAAPFFPLHPAIQCYDLSIGYESNNGQSFWNKLFCYPLKQLRHRRRLARLLKRLKADVVVSMFCHEASFLPAIQDGSRKVLEVHFSRLKRLQYNRRGLWRWADIIRSRMDVRVARRYDRFVVLTREDRALWGDLPNITNIPNPIEGRAAAASALTRKRVLAVGRLTHQKGFDLLVEAWAEVCAHNPDWTLTIAGEGPMEQSLRNQIARLRLEDRVELLGARKDVGALYASASILALSSRYEGLPMVLLEAQSWGLPIVAFQCQCGPKDVITHGEDGFLVPPGDTHALAMRLLTLINDPAMRRQFGAMAYQHSQRYSMPEIMHRWQQLFDSLVVK